MSHPLVSPPTGPPAHRALFQISTELLHEILRIPRQTRIVGADLDPPAHTITLTLEDPRLYGVEEGQELPIISPVYTSLTTLSGVLIRGEWIFEDSIEITGDTFPEDPYRVEDNIVTDDGTLAGRDVTEKELVAHDHVWGSSGTPRRCEICGLPS